MARERPSDGILATQTQTQIEEDCPPSVIVPNAQNCPLTSLELVAQTGEVTRSGNPGYQLNQPLIVAEGGSATTSKKVSVLGTYMKGPDAKGACI